VVLIQATTIEVRKKKSSSFFHSVGCEDGLCLVHVWEAIDRTSISGKIKKNRFAFDSSGSVVIHYPLDFYFERLDDTTTLPLSTEYPHFQLSYDDDDDDD
jgi:hypothetical protein